MLSSAAEAVLSAFFAVAWLAHAERTIAATVRSARVMMKKASTNAGRGKPFPFPLSSSQRSSKK
jgi:hypothetical protein